METLIAGLRRAAMTGKVGQVGLVLAALILGLSAGLGLARKGAPSSASGDLSLGFRPGFLATSPAHIPARGWREVTLRALRAFSADQIPAVAGGVTFFSLLALFPGLGAFVSLYGLVSNVDDVRRQIVAMGGVLPGGAVTVIGDEMARLTATNPAHLGFAFATSLLVSVWSANAGVKALINGLNIACEARETRGFIRLNLTSLAFTIGVTVFAVAAFGAIISVPRMLSALPPAASGVLGLARWPVALATTTALLSLLYRFGPARDQEHWRWITPGSALASVIWMVMSVGFSLYVANFGHFNRTYGSLGAMIGFMTWIWLSVTVVLFGAELNSELERQTLIETHSQAKALPR